MIDTAIAEDNIRDDNTYAQRVIPGVTPEQEIPEYSKFLAYKISAENVILKSKYYNYNYNGTEDLLDIYLPDNYEYSYYESLNYIKIKLTTQNSITNISENDIIENISISATANNDDAFKFHYILPVYNKSVMVGENIIYNNTITRDNYMDIIPDSYVKSYYNDLKLKCLDFGLLANIYINNNIIHINVIRCEMPDIVVKYISFDLNNAEKINYWNA